ncbi:MAG: carboxypeptidase-like regulatory domain-containing protein, partial [Planctomycetota bacterium]
EFVVPKVAAGEYVLRTAPHGESILRETGKTLVIPPGGEETTEFTIVRGGDVKISVTGPDGKVLENVELIVTGEDETEPRTFRMAVASGTIRDVAPGKARFRVAKDGYATAESEVTVVKDQVVTASVRMEKKR